MKSGVFLVKCGCATLSHHTLSLSLPVPGCGREEAERQSSSVVSGRCCRSVGRPCRTRAHQPAECKTRTVQVSLSSDSFRLT